MLGREYVNNSIFMLCFCRRGEDSRMVNGFHKFGSAYEGD